MKLEKRYKAEYQHQYWLEKSHDKIHRHPYIINPFIKKLIPACFVLLLLILPMIMAQGQVVQVPQPAQPKKTNIFGSVTAILTSAWFWGVIVIGALIVGFCIGLFFLFRWLIKYIKTRSDIFWRLRDERIKLAKIHRRFSNSKHFWKVYKNTPIRLVKVNSDGKPYITEPIAYYRGDYISNEGNIVICMNLRDDKKWLIFPKTSLLIVPDKEKIDIRVKTREGKVKKIEINNLPKAKDIVRFNDNEVLIYAEGFSIVGQQIGFLVPVLRATDGRIVDLSLPAFQSLKEVILGNYLYEQTGEFVDVQKKAIHLNPDVQYKMKTADSSQAVEVPKTPA